jgi:hypothetical protein
LDQGEWALFLSLRWVGWMTFVIGVFGGGLDLLDKLQGSWGSIRHPVYSLTVPTKSTIIPPMTSMI